MTDIRKRPAPWGRETELKQPITVSFGSRYTVRFEPTPLSLPLRTFLSLFTRCVRLFSLPTVARFDTAQGAKPKWSHPLQIASVR